MRRLAVVLFLLSALAGCGRLPWNFESLSLEEKVAAYEKYLQGRGHPKIRARAQISWHGWPAADLMSQYLQGSREGLPVQEALEIIHLVQTRGCSLQGTAAKVLWPAISVTYSRRPRGCWRTGGLGGGLGLSLCLCRASRPLAATALGRLSDL